MKTDHYSVSAQLTIFSLIAGVLAHLPPGVLRLIKSDERITKACDMMRQHPEEQWNNAALARNFNLTANFFSQLFRKIVGVTPYSYLQSTRYVIAEKLVRTTALGNKEICGQIGIQDPFHFSREFKRIYGLSPAHYRKILFNPSDAV